GFAEDLDPASGRQVQTKHEAQQRCLAGAVVAEQSQDATGLQLERHVVQGDLAILVDFGELVALDYQVAGAVGHAAPSSRDRTRSCRPYNPAPRRFQDHPPLPYVAAAALAAVDS